MKYLVKHKITGKYLSKTYYKDNKQTEDINEAYKFSAFELVVATRTFLREKQKFIIYPDKKETRKKLLEELYEKK